MKRKFIAKRFLAFALSLGLVFTSVNVPSATIVANAAEVVNGYAAPENGTHGATYDATTKQVTFFVTSEDVDYNSIPDMWYKTYSTYTDAATSHISNNNGDFIAGLAPTNLVENAEHTQKSVTVDVPDGTGAILYYFRTTQARPSYEHIIVIPDAETVSDDTTPDPSDPSDPADPSDPSDPSDPADPSVVTSGYVNLEEADTELYAGTDWAGAAATVEEDGTKAVITASSFGWNGEWGLQYMIKDLGLEDNTTYTVEFDITPTVDKKVFIKLDNAGFIAEAVELTANETYHYSKTVECGSFSADKPFLYFAIGQMAGEDANRNGNITIENLSVTGPRKPATPDATGKQYDFSAVSDNALYDYADPGTDKEGYTLVWADEFNGNYETGANVDEATGLNLDNWAPQLGDGTTDCGNPGWGNKELQAYTADAKNIGVNEDIDEDGTPDGVLRITAAYEDAGYVYGTETPKNYTSARLRTTKPGTALFNTTYGYIEARISLPETKGAWPAFWMLPESTSIYGNWPVSGEIDIMETVGAGQNGSKACGTLHWGAPEHVYKGSGYVDLSSNFSYFHTYAVDWEPGKITWYYDGEEINNLTSWKSGISGASDALSFDAPFDEPFYILLNLAVDSGQFGASINKATFQEDINMYVDYVRVYHRTEGYAESVTRTASDDAKDDWEQYAGINQIADITAESIDLESSGGMSDGTYDVTKWALSNQDDATGATIDKYTDASGKTWAKVGITSAGANDYSVQLIGHYDAKAGYVYKVSFDTYAEGAIVGKTVNCDSKEWAGWSTYGIQSFELTSEPTTTSYLFEQTEDFNKCRIEFNVGAQATGTVYIGNVKVEIVDPSSLEKEAEVRKPLADGNLIYNSTFDQGDNHIGYWRATEGTAFVVPRYTTTALKETDLSVMDVAAGGVHYYERRAQVSSDGTPTIYQPDLKLSADDYAVQFDLYSENDTNVTVGIYRATEDGLGTKLLSTTAPYSASAGVKTYNWTFTSTEEVENAALVLSFDEGSSVQIDNVTLIGASQATPVDPTPVTSESGWEANGADGGAAELTKDGDVWVATGVKSGSNWYSPQIGSDTFGLTAGNTYTLTFKAKLEGDQNGTFEYIIQESGGSWTVIQDVKKVDTATLGTPDEDGFYTYTIDVPVTTSIGNIHVNFGLGNSAANNATFSFKEVALTLKTVSEEGDDEDGGISKMPETYTITYELDGGVNAESNPIGYTSVSDNSIELAAPTKDGFTFLGWTLGGKGTDYITSISTNQTGTIVVYANWQEDPKPEDPKPEDPKSEDPKSEDPQPSQPGTTPDTGSKDDKGGSTTPSKVAVTKVTLKGDSKKIAAGKKLALTATVTPANATDKSLTWKSSNTKYAKVSNKGVVTTKKAGAGKKVTITATANDGSGKKATYKITIMKKPVKKIKLKASKTTVKAGKKVTIKATVTPSSTKTTNTALTWKSSNTKYATVSKKGVVTTKKAGKGKKVTITATATDGSKKKAKITIKIAK